MSTPWIDIAVGASIFVFGIGYTIRKFATQDRLAFTVVAILTPLAAVVAVFRLFYLICRGKAQCGPLPARLEEAEIIVEQQRQQMFGGEVRKPAFTRSWQRAYERELEMDTERLQKVARRFLAVA